MVKYYRWGWVNTCIFAGSKLYINKKLQAPTPLQTQLLMINNNNMAFTCIFNGWCNCFPALPAQFVHLDHSLSSKHGTYQTLAVCFLWVLLYLAAFHYFRLSIFILLPLTISNIVWYSVVQQLRITDEQTCRVTCDFRILAAPHVLNHCWSHDAHVGTLISSIWYQVSFSLTAFSEPPIFIWSKIICTLCESDHVHLQIIIYMY
jgi:hypothetical protein